MLFFFFYWKTWRDFLNCSGCLQRCQVEDLEQQVRVRHEHVGVCWIKCLNNLLLHSQFSCRTLNWNLAFTFLANGTRTFEGFAKSWDTLVWKRQNRNAKLRSLWGGDSLTHFWCCNFHCRSGLEQKRTLLSLNCLSFPLLQLDNCISGLIDKM